MDLYFPLLLSGIAFFAFFLKAITGFGPAIILISLASLFLSPKDVIATSAILDFIAGSILFRGEGARSEPKFLLSITGAIVLGTVIGALGLSHIPAQTYIPLLGAAILSLSIWFAVFRGRSGASTLRSTLPSQCDLQDLGFSFLGGLSGGLFGISGPPIIFHLGRRYSKDAFRGILITIFLLAAVARIASYAAAGMVSGEVLKFVAYCVPGQLLGLYIGRRAFLKISEQVFSRAVAVLLFFVSLKLLFS